MLEEEKQTHELIDELLKRKDPALVGIRKILRSKTDVSATKSFALHTPEIFGAESKEKSRENETIFTDKELKEIKYGESMLELEEKVKQKESEIEKVKQEAFENGKTAGIEEQQNKTKTAIGEIEEKMKEEVKKRLAEQINQELDDRENYFKSLEEDVYQTITAIVKKILDAEIQTNQNLIINAIKKSLSHISQRGAITIRVSNDDFEYVNSQISLFNRHRDGTYKINIVQDEHIKVGGCLIETDSTIVDAQIENRSEKTLELIERIWNETKSEIENKNISDESTNKETHNEEILSETVSEATVATNEKIENDNILDNSQKSAIDEIKNEEKTENIENIEPKNETKNP
ncbi:MAG: FliH/SctL family protein [Chitinivibrionia bacterium]|nr:FliH/SctL family protein [Chitinivibrionia bacterium]